MKRFAGIVLALLVCLAIYYDLTVGSLPGIEKGEAMMEQETAASTLPYVEIRVQPGDTVLSIIEQNGGVPGDISIEQIITDFSLLNEGLDPLNIQPGEIYKFPVYTSGS